MRCMIIYRTSRRDLVVSKPSPIAEIIVAKNILIHIDENPAFIFA